VAPGLRVVLEVMGPDIFFRVYPYWQAAQAQAVQEACRDEAHRTWVADWLATSIRRGWLRFAVAGATAQEEVVRAAVGSGPVA
jgi:hypothetical protein